MKLMPYSVLAANKQLLNGYIFWNFGGYRYGCVQVYQVVPNKQVSLFLRDY